MAEPWGQFFLLVAVFASKTSFTEGQQFCRDMNYWCKEGHCCGRGKCCTYYYEIWWFWSIWIVVALILLWCYLHKRQREAEHGQQIQAASAERVELAPMANCTAQTGNGNNNYLSMMHSGNKTKLPSYSEVRDLPKQPPPYNHIAFTSLQNTSLVHSALIPSDGDNGNLQTTMGIGPASIKRPSDICTSEPPTNVSSILTEPKPEDSELAPQYQSSNELNQTLVLHSDCRSGESPLRMSPPPPYVSEENLHDVQSSPGDDQASWEDIR